MLKNLFTQNFFINKYQNLINQINIRENNLKSLTNNELRLEILKLKKKYKKTSNLNLLITESFALTREASIRTLGLRHFDVQLLGGLLLNNQNITEIETGEGKTLTATLPALLNSLTEKGVHLVTVNNYLANRDQNSMGQIYRLLGIKTGLIQPKMNIFNRKKNYKADITYVTNDELVFDFLRDNMALKLNNIVLRPFNYCIIDEIDSILIDEALTPLIISKTIKTSIEKYIIAAEIIHYLNSEIHYKIDEKNKNIILTIKGNEYLKQLLNIEDLYDQKNPWISYISNALKAKNLFLKDIHYIIQNNQIIIIDEFTGRFMLDRQWGNGLHQAIQAKEKLLIQQKTEIIATITYQNFFLLYPKLVGMTGTGKLAEKEFKQIYNLSVQKIPTIQINCRKNLPDLIYKNQFLKWKGIAETCKKISNTGQPILIGTTTIEKSEILGKILNEYGLSYFLLNAKSKNIRQESEIIAKIGKKKNITIATNMAGRGTDILLGGNIFFENQYKLYKILTFYKNNFFNKNQTIFQFLNKKNNKGISQKFISIFIFFFKTKKFNNLSNIYLLTLLEKNKTVKFNKNFLIQFLINELKIFNKKIQKQENEIINNLGGLFVIGTERNKSKRIDDQLRGRCGRQGNSGISRFFLSLDDHLFRLFGENYLQKFTQTQIEENFFLESKFITKSLNFIQKQIEEKNYQQRKQLFNYNQILNKQQNIIYFERQYILKSSFIQKNIFVYGEQIILEFLINLEKKNIIAIENLFGINLHYIKKLKKNINNFNNYELKIHLFNEFWLTYQLKLLELSIYGNSILKNFEKNIILINIDQIWSEYLQNITLLRDILEWRKYGQKNTLYDYNKEIFYIFKSRKKILQYLIIYNILRIFIL